jgi:hypothetical protein
MKKTAYSHKMSSPFERAADFGLEMTFYELRLIYFLELNGET